MSVTLIHPTREARAIGAEHGKNQASWVELDAVSAAQLIKLDNDGDPWFWVNYLSPLSGEHAGDYSISDLITECGVADDAPDWLRDEVISAYEQAHTDAWHDSLIARALQYVAD